MKRTTNNIYPCIVYIAIGDFGHILHTWIIPLRDLWVATPKSSLFLFTLFFGRLELG